MNKHVSECKCMWVDRIWIELILFDSIVWNKWVQDIERDSGDEWVFTKEKGKIIECTSDLHHAFQV